MTRIAALRLTSAIALAALCAAAASAQDEEAAPVETPRTADGVPDLNGTWDNGSGIAFVVPVFEGDSVCLTGCAPRPTGGGPPPPPDRPDYKPEFEAMVADLEARQVEEDPVLRCNSPGLPRIGPPDKIVQQTDQVIFLYEDVTGDHFRIIPLDGRPHRTDVERNSLGDSVGRWEGDTLVVDTVNLREDTWLTDDGSFHTADLRVEERITRNGDEIEWRATAFDPEVLEEPWALRPRTAFLTDVEMAHSAPCIERDLEHVVDGTHHDNPR